MNSVPRKFYFLNESNQQIGPFDEHLLKEMYQKGIIQERTLIWSEGYESWITYNDIFPSSPPEDEKSVVEEEFRRVRQNRISDKQGKQAKEAFELFSNSAERDCLIAQTALGWCYENGFGVESNEFRAVSCYRKAAQCGETSAQLLLGKHLLCRKQIKEAFSLLQQAADKGDAEALFIVGVCLQDGKGVKRDLLKAVEYYIQASDQGYAKAQCNLGYCYEYLLKGQKEPQKAALLYAAAAAQNDPLAIHNMSCCYTDGIGVKKDPEKAKKLKKDFRESNCKLPFNLKVSLRKTYPWTMAIGSCVLALSIHFGFRKIESDYDKLSYSMIEYYRMERALNHYVPENIIIPNDTMKKKRKLIPISVISVLITSHLLWPVIAVFHRKKVSSRYNFKSVSKQNN